MNQDKEINQINIHIPINETTENSKTKRITRIKLLKMEKKKEKSHHFTIAGTCNISLNHAGTNS